ncbi:MAG: hypothetical protein ACNS60_18680 [Candidatus Cyclobacteriaceae bacterium M2_1C_046]
MKNLWFYKWYGILIAFLLQAAFFYIYYSIEIFNQATYVIILYVLIYQGIFIAIFFNYSLLYEAYKKFIELKNRSNKDSSD